MPPPTIYKGSPDGEPQSPPALSSKEMCIQYQQHKNAVVIAPKLFSVSNRFLSSNCSWIAVFPFCLFYHHPGDFPKLRSACWGHIPLTGGISCVSMARLVYHEGWAPPTTISASFPPLLHRLGDSETSVQIWLSLIINHIPGA